MSTSFLREIYDASEELGIAPSTLCRLAAGNSKLPKRIAAGGTVTIDTVERIRLWIKDRRRKAA
jgi:hypothetical protein